MALTYLILSLLLSVCINAAEINENVYELSDFVVSDKEDKGYFSGSSTSATKANELIKNTPVNVTVLNQELLDDLGINTTEDLAQVSASIDTDPTSYSLDQIRIRGFRNTFTRYNGFRRTLPRDGYNINRYDIIKGANSMIFGQASPGGTVNAIPLLANFRKDTGSVAYSFGNKDLSKKVINYNKAFSDKLAIRLMLVDNYKGYEHAYKNYDLKSQTLAISYRPDTSSSFQLHLENVDSEFSFPNLSIKDATMVDDSVDGMGPNNLLDSPGYSSNDETSKPYDGYLSSSESRSMKSNFNVPYNSEWLNFAEDQMLFNLFWHTRNNDYPSALSNDGLIRYGVYLANGYLNPPGQENGGNFLGNEELRSAYTSSEYINVHESDIPIIASGVRQYLREYYSSINELNYGYQSGPDKSKKISGGFNTLDYQKVFSNGLELSLSANYQSQEGKNLARDSYGISRVLDSYSKQTDDWPKTLKHVYFNDVPGIDEIYTPDPIKNYYTDGTLNAYEAALDAVRPDPFIRTYWTKTEGESERKGLKGTLLYEKGYTLPIIGKIENKYLLGWDIINVNKSEIRYDQIPDYGGDNGGDINSDNPLNPDGSYLNPYLPKLSNRAEWLTHNKITDREKAFEYIRIKEGFGSDRSIMRFNNLIETDFVILDQNGDYVSIVPSGEYRAEVLVDENGLPVRKDNGRLDEKFEVNSGLYNKEIKGQRAQLAKFQESARLSADINTNSQWFATQNSLYDGRLRTLVGLRLDKIKVESTLRKTSLFGDGSGNLYIEDDNGNKSYLSQDQINQKQKEKYVKLSPSLGALYWVNQNLGIFANYAESIESPTGQDRTPIGTLPDPEIGKGLEFGVRYSTPDNSLDTQLAFYAIEKENDNEFGYSNLQLLSIYPREETIKSTPEIAYIYKLQGGGSNYVLNESTLPGRRANGDVTLSKGIELDINYNPTRKLNFIASINHNMDNKILEIHPSVQRWLDENEFDINEQIDIFGRPDFRGSLTGKYSFKSGKLKGLTLGLSQHYRSGSNIGRYYFYFDESGNLLNKNFITGQTGNPNIMDFNDANGDKIRQDDEAADVDIIDKSKTKKYFIKSKAEHNTIGFINYSNSFSSFGKKYKYSINFRVNNLFNIEQFINRSNYGTYRESRSFNITTKIHF